MYAIKWLNRFSGESGYVGEIVRREGHFNNTFDVKKAKTFKTEAAAKKAVTDLIAMGEGKANEFILTKV